MLTHLSDAWNQISPPLKNRDVLLFLDYDGTLTPIVERPELAELSSAARKILQELSPQKNIKVAILSGRALADLKKRVNIPGLIYSGNHGFELAGPKIEHVHPGAVSACGLLHKIAERLKKAYAPFPRVLTENKKYSLSIHYRQLNPKETDLAKILLFKEIGPYLEKSQVILAEGKKVWEVRPAIEWNKGKTALWLLARLLAKTGTPALPIYIGDDLTDEDAFKALKHKGITIRVTEDPAKPSEADYFLYSPAEVLKFLRTLKKIKTPISSKKEKLCR